MRSPYNAWGVYDMAPVPLRGMGAVMGYKSSSLGGIDEVKFSILPPPRCTVEWALSYPETTLGQIRSVALGNARLFNMAESVNQAVSTASWMQSEPLPWAIGEVNENVKEWLVGVLQQEEAASARKDYVTACAMAFLQLAMYKTVAAECSGPNGYYFSKQWSNVGARVTEMSKRSNDWYSMASIVGVDVGKAASAMSAIQRAKLLAINPDSYGPLASLVSKFLKWTQDNFDSVMFDIIQSVPVVPKSQPSALLGDRYLSNLISYNLYLALRNETSRKMGEAMTSGLMQYLQKVREVGGFGWMTQSQVAAALKLQVERAWLAAHPTVSQNIATLPGAVAAGVKPTDKCPPGTAYTLKGKCISAKCAKGIPCNAQSAWDAYQCKCVSKSMLGPLTMEGGGGSQTIGGKGSPGSQTFEPFPFVVPPQGTPPGDVQSDEQGEATPEWVIPAVIGGAVLFAVVGVIATRK